MKRLSLLAVLAMVLVSGSVFGRWSGDTDGAGVGGANGPIPVDHWDNLVGARGMKGSGTVNSWKE